MRNVIRSLACGLGLGLGAAATGAVVPGVTDTFEDGSSNGWTSGAANPSQPANIASGGPAGADDNYLLTVAHGGSGIGGKLVVIAGPQWTGDFTAAGVSAIVMDLKNSGATDLSLRLVLFGSGGGTAISSSAVVIPARSSWVQASFGLAPAQLTALPLLSTPGTLAAVSGLRLFYGSQALFPGENVAAQLGMDNVTAVPEPTPAVLLGCGLLALAWRKSWPKSWPNRQQLPAPFG